MSLFPRWYSPTLPWKLRELGALSMNRRNGDYILLSNPREHFPRVDDKLETKRICDDRGIPVPKTYTVLERYGDVRRFPSPLLDAESFVVKPCSGSAGRGILVVLGYSEERFECTSGEVRSLADLRYHVSMILSGLYSLAGQPDRVLVEQRVTCHPVFAELAVEGTPDIRIVLYRGVPVMAMVRLPTSLSRGRANLHQGALGAGVDLVTGRTFGGVCKNRSLSIHPDTGVSVEGLRVPNWHDFLRSAMNLSDGVGLGYLGVDFVLDAYMGPVVLEANARPGLAIQVANRRGLLPRLTYVDAHMDARKPDTLTADERMELVEALSRLP